MFMNQFEDKILDWIDGSHLLGGCERVLLAVSGGADSMAMVHALCRLKSAGRLECDFAIGHVNHCLRGTDSDGDAAFVAEMGRQLGLETICEVVDVPAYAKSHKLSIETAARRLRLKTLCEMAEKHGCKRIATAHHADDQAETLIHRLMRGTGFRGLCGIKPVSVVYTGAFIRPMLSVRRAEVMDYCCDNTIQWREDASNASLAFTRNRIRHRLLPALSGQQDVSESLAVLATAAQSLQKRMEDSFGAAMKELGAGKSGFQRIVYDRAKLQDVSAWVFYEILRMSLVTLGAGLRNYKRSHFDAIREMLTQPRAKANFPGHIEISVEGDKVTIARTDIPISKPNPDEVLLSPGHSAQFGPWTVSTRLLERQHVDVEQFLQTKDSQTEWFDADKVTGILIIRPRKAGDRFRPIGGKGEKKIARFLKDSQLDADTRQHAFIIQDSEKILWLVPVRMAEAAGISSETQHILEVRVKAD